MQGAELELELDVQKPCEEGGIQRVPDGGKTRVGRRGRCPIEAV